MRQTSLFEEGREQLEEILEILPFKRVRDESLDFKDVPAGTGVYGIHPYPAMFHFLVVRKFIEEFSREGDWVLDPFMGSGVAAVECLINNRNFIGYDINPLAVLISKVRTTPIEARELFNTLILTEKRYHQNYPEDVQFPNIHYWFDQETIEKLSKLKKAIFSIEKEEVSNFFKVVFSEVVRRVSKAEFSEFKLLKKKKNNNNLDVIRTFREVSIRNISLMTEFYKSYSYSDVKIILENKNILETKDLEENSIDLVITSPPYGDSRTTVAYGQFSRLSLRWLGFEENVDKTSLGGKPKDITLDLPSPTLYNSLEKIANKDEKRAKEVFSFYKDLFNSIQIITRKVKKKGTVCFIVGNRKVKGEELPTDKISADFFESLGFEHQKTLIRAISNKRMPIENSPSNIKGEKDSTMRYEYIVVLKKI